ncbi:MAG: hypothetical protein AMS22_17035 [Thiotrichales bacterium SG8_50]|jgi:hypothetical protein|nr:MAG: hypothetical protein AMS22_17035 [Thiotrichales bacterium SG8_50]
MSLTHPTAPVSRRSLIALAVVIFGVLSIVGSGGSYDLGPVWVETDVLVADIDGDTRPDVLTLAMLTTSYEQKEGHLLVYRQTSTPGVFAAPVPYVVGRYPWRVVADDIDGDGRPDLVITDVDTNTTLLMLQDGANPGQFLAPQPLITGAHSYDAVIADLNSDGAPDVAATDSAYGSGRVVLRYQDPLNRGSFGPQVDVAMPDTTTNLVAGDVDGDGLADMLAWVYTNPPGVYPPTTALVVAYQNSGGGFTMSGLLAPQTGLNAGRLAIADANVDGRRDLFAFETPFSRDYTAQLLVVPQTATARLFDAPIYTSLAGIHGLDDAVLVDFNQDGAPDAAVVGYFPVGSDWDSRANLLINNGVGGFVLSDVFATPISVSRVAAGDLDGDGRVDIVLLGSENRCLVMFQSATPGSFLPPRALR